ncbi:hypothetical protein ACFV3R_10865 [Streptomyces sp. NPDC059740]|uniref:hypothetical protein n=1 Tax=Streptomyces sp. NPDC059740 TaxID=3346926 RepID=UPI003667CE55
MSLSLASTTAAVARLLDACEPLEPLRLCLSSQDVQAEVCGTEPAASASLAQLAEATGADLYTSPYGGTSSLTADLGASLVLVAAVAPPVDGGGTAGRETSTRATADLLRSLTPWAHGLNHELLPEAELWVEDHGGAFTVRLLTTVGSSSALESVAAAAGDGLDRLRTWRTDSGVDGVGHLPCGRPVQLGVVFLS